MILGIVNKILLGIHLNTGYLNTGCPFNNTCADLFIEHSCRRYEYGDRTPSPQTVEVIAQKFNTSVDYLVGLTDDSKPKQYVVDREKSPELFELIEICQKKDNSEQIKRLIEYYRMLTDQGGGTAMTLFKFWGDGSDAAKALVDSINVRSTENFNWVYKWWGVIPVFITTYVPFFLASNYVPDMEPKKRKRFVLGLWGLVAILLVVLIPLGII